MNPVSFYLLLRGLCHTGVKVVVLGAELITKSFLQLLSLGLSSVFESSTETSSLLQ